MKTKESVSTRPTGPRTKDPRKTQQQQQKVLVLGPMDLQQKNPQKTQRQKKMLEKGPMDI